MNGGTISGNRGCGVVVSDGGTFTMTGGTIEATNNASWGNVAFVWGGEKWRNNAAGPSVNLDSNISGRNGGWE